ncbi:MAG TPA: trigger factor [Longimicrobiaceae bacterium]|nr:trigger factor [Longimicrobiaceae bacterium]
MAAENTELRFSVAEPSSWSRKLSITVPRERVARVRRTVASQLAGNVRLPGFRKGKLPESLVEKQFGASIEQQTLDRVIQESYREALDQGGFQPISQGEVQNVQYAGKESDLTFDVQFEVQPTLSLARTGGFVVPRPSDDVDDAEADAVLERLRSGRAELHAVEGRGPEVGDEVTVEITALDREGAEAQPYRFALGEGQAIPGIEEAILSLGPGEEREFEVEFPEDFPEAEQAGTRQKMRIRLLEVQQRALPALDDDFARAVGEYDSMEALRARVRADLREDARRRAEGAVRDALLGQILDANPIEVPDSMVERYLDFMTGGGDGAKKPKRTAEQEERFSQFRELMRPQAEAALRKMMVVEHLADREGLRATQDEVDARVERIAEAQGRTPSDVWLELEKRGQLQGLEGEITEDRVFDWLRQQNTVG